MKAAHVLLALMAASTGAPPPHAAARFRRRCAMLTACAIIPPAQALKHSDSPAGLHHASAGDMDCIGQELSLECSLLLSSTGTDSPCSPACAASVAAVIQTGCWDSVVSMAATIGQGGNL